MPEFLVESYVSRHAAIAERDAERARRSAHELTRAGTPVRCLRWIFVPEDETCYFHYRAASADAVREVSRRAGLRCDRVTEAVSR